MSCCGEPDASKDLTNRPQSSRSAPITQPPPPVGNISPFEKQNIFNAPAIPSPPPAHPNPNGHGQPGWQQSSSPSPPSFHTNNYQQTQAVSPAPGFDEFGGIGANSLRIDTSTPPMSPPPRAMSTSFQKKDYAQTLSDEGKMSVAIDFGTTFSGVAYGSSRIDGGKVQQILQWPGAIETYRKIPTCLLYDEHGQVLAWGLEAKNASSIPGTTKCEWFKLFLEPQALRDESAVDPRLPALPVGKHPIDLVADFLSCLWEYAKEQITREINIVADLDSADVWLTVPAAWDAKGCDLMRDAAISAGLVQSARAGEQNWRDRLRIITEPEAAAVHCANMIDLHHLKPSQTFVVVDAGGGTVDLSAYRIIGQMQHLEIAEMSARSGANCGSIFLDLRFRELVRALLADHPAHLDPASLAYFMHSFQETDKLTYQGEADDDNFFQFECFNTEDPSDPSVGLVNGQLAIPGTLLRREVFDPVIDQVLALIDDQLKRIDHTVSALILVGGFAGSDYLLHRVRVSFGDRIKVIARPPDADTATARGAAQYGLSRRPLVSSVIVPRAYIMKVKLPAEEQDWMLRPAYISHNAGGHPICENRLQYLVQKGAILRKGQRIATKFCKFSQTFQDSTFVAVLYTSNVEKRMRYTDEGETTELLKWTVDLSSLPTFRQNAAMPQPNGFYTEFELGLELDSAEVRGVLLYEGRDWGRIRFDYLD